MEGGAVRSAGSSIPGIDHDWSEPAEILRAVDADRWRDECRDVGRTRRRTLRGEREDSSGNVGACGSLGTEPSQICTTYATAGSGACSDAFVSRDGRNKWANEETPGVFQTRGTTSNRVRLGPIEGKAGNSDFD